MIISTLAFVCAFGLFLVVWRKYSSLSLVTPLAVFVGFEVVSVWPPTVYAQGIEMADAYAAVLMVFAFFAFLIGFTAVASLTQTTRNVIVRFAKRPLLLEGSERAYLRVTIVFTVLLFALSTYLYGGTSLLLGAIEGYARGESQTDVVTQLSLDREALTKGYYFGEAYKGQGVILQTLRTGWLYLTVLTAAVARATGRWRWGGISALLLLLSFNYVGAAARFQLVEVLLTLLVGLSFFTKFTRKRFALAVASVAILVLAVSPLSIQTVHIDLQDRPWGQLAAAMRDRILFGDGIHNVEVIQFTDQGLLPYGWGRYHWEKALTALPGVTAGVPLSQQLQMIRSGNPIDTAFASMTYFGVLYADFGPIGPLVGYAGIGAFVAWLQAYMFRMRKSVLQIPFIALLTIGVGGLTIGSSVSALAGLFVLIAFHLALVAVFRFAGGTSRRAPRSLRPSWRTDPVQAEGYR
jgi:hypothetical protein